MRKVWIRTAVVAAAAAAVTLGAAVVWAPWASDPPSAPAPSAVGSATSGFRAAIDRAQQRVDRVPSDWQAWADLGMAHVQLARVTSDAGAYPRAQEALRRSLAVRPAERNAPALTGLAALAAARHEFRTAERWARQAVKVDAYSADAHGALADALIELGRPEPGFAAVQKMVDLRPDTASFARASYTYELRGELPRARELMSRAREAATEPADITFTLTHLAALAVTAGDLDAAAAHLAEGLTRQPGDPGLLAGRARLAFLRGDTAAAVADQRAAVEVLPTVEHGHVLGDLLWIAGDRLGAERAYALSRAAAGVGDPDVEHVLFWADHGEAARAVAAAQQIYTARRSTVVEEALGWALHAAGRDAEALAHADAALAMGVRDARTYYHRGMIRLTLGDRAGAHRDLSEALRINPRFGPRDAETARAALANLESAS